MGGVLIFDAWYGPGVLTDHPTERIKRVEWNGCDITRKASPDMHPNENIVDVRYDFLITDKEGKKLADFTEEHHMRYFFKPEMEDYLSQAGFNLLDCIDCSSRKEPNFDSWTSFFIARVK